LKGLKLRTKVRGRTDAENEDQEVAQLTVDSAEVQEWLFEGEVKHQVHCYAN
jgi:hypothetical protein